MRLRALNYSQFAGQPSEWRISDLILGPINLLVGKNASGKTRTLNVIKALAAMVGGDKKVEFQSGTYQTLFMDGDEKIEYVLQYENAWVQREVFTRAQHRLLVRGQGGVGMIFAKKEGRDVDFQTPENELAVVARRDKIQHPYFESLSDWGKSVLHYQFGTKLGQDHVAILVKDLKATEDVRDADRVVGIFRKGQKDFGQSYVDTIVRDMSEIGYPLEEIGTKPSARIQIQPPLSDVFVLYVKEAGVAFTTEQDEMSQGMFRALSIVILLNYAALAMKPSCVLIDDIGEGLDFERSCALIRVLMSKAEQSEVQLIMSTNDRFVMNQVPLETWSVLRRVGGTCRVYNYFNSKEIFDRFKFTGLNNFDFLAMDFVEQPEAGG